MCVCARSVRPRSLTQQVGRRVQRTFTFTTIQLASSSSTTTTNSSSAGRGQCGAEEFRATLWHR